ncbi:SDR family NAD(P)-dependent oxidoreductase [Streptomyces sp. NPDC056716]|uniref:SDR family NAD(P)-dependent oxidoreductase n=1 Tax=unclassified Streptomyces TaxID=2593676 RepID=UPI0036749961
MLTATQRFDKGTAVITGAGSGIGEGFARHLAALGMTVVVADIDTGRARSVADSLTADGARADARFVDVTDARSVDDLAAAVFDRYGSVELLINNAGVEDSAGLWDIGVERWNTIMAINVNGVFHGVRSFVPRLGAQGTEAVIVNVSSVASMTTSPFQAPYIASKRAILALTECLHQEVALAGFPIQVSAVLPGPVRSRLFDAVRRDTPADDGLAGQMLTALENIHETIAHDALDAARQMLESVARGDFWVFSDEQYCRPLTENRARQLHELSPPPDPVAGLAQLGVTAGQPGGEE